MSRRALAAMTQREAAQIPVNTWNIGGALQVKNPDYLGETDYVCPSCGTVLVEQTNEVGIVTLKRLDCYSCGAHTSGEKLNRAEAKPIRRDKGD